MTDSPAALLAALGSAALCIAIVGFCTPGPGESIKKFLAMGATGTILLAAAILIFLTMTISDLAYGRDDGRYAGSSLKPWFDSLRSGKGLCCSDADGTALSDADWESSGGHYRVRVPNRPTQGDGRPPDLVWIEVPEEAVITEPNRAGRTMVWPIYGYNGLSIRCFMPGPLA